MFVCKLHISNVIVTSLNYDEFAFMECNFVKALFENEIFAEGLKKIIIINGIL